MMAAVAPIIAPRVAFFSGLQQAFAQRDGCWRRLSAEDVAHRHTGCDREAHELKLGIHIVPAHNGLMRIGFDLIRLDINLRATTIARLQRRWEGEAASFSKSLRRWLDRRTHFSRSFAEFAARPEDVESWKAELEVILGNPDSFESVLANAHQ